MGILLLCIASGVQAQCISHRYGNSVCPPDGGSCWRVMAIYHADIEE